LVFEANNEASARLLLEGAMKTLDSSEASNE
jgi:hypothetical protein